jgi:hypothetical protein
MGGIIIKFLDRTVCLFVFVYHFPLTTICEKKNQFPLIYYHLSLLFFLTHVFHLCHI